MNLKQIAMMFLLLLLPAQLLLHCDVASAQLYGEDVEVVFNLRNEPTLTFTSTIGPGIEFQGLQILQGFFDIDFDETGVTFVNYPGNIIYGLDQNTDDFFSFEFTSFDEKRVAEFSVDTVVWESFPNLSHGEDWVRLQHTDFWHRWPANRPNRYRISVVPEPCCFTLCVLTFAIGCCNRMRRRKTTTD